MRNALSRRSLRTPTSTWENRAWSIQVRCHHAPTLCRSRANPKEASPKDLALLQDMETPPLCRGCEGAGSWSTEATESLQVARVVATVSRIGQELASFAFHSPITGWHELDIPLSDLPVRPRRGMYLGIKLYFKDKNIVGFAELRVVPRRGASVSPAERFLPKPPSDRKDRKRVITYRKNLLGLGVRQEDLDAS